MKEHDPIETAIRNKINDAKKINIKAENFCFTYARVSTDEQKDEGNSLDEQGRRLLKYVAEKKLFPLYSYSSSESAYKEGRLNFNSMLSMCEKYKVKILILKNYDRATRNDYDWPRVLRLIKDKKLIIHFYELNQILHDASKAEEFFNADIQVAMAKYWSNKISQGVKSAYDNFIIEDKTPVKGIDGYTLEQKPRRWIIDRDREPVIRRIFHLFNEGHTMRKITAMMRKEGYRTKGTSSKKKDKTPAPFTITSIERILKHPMYAGYYELNGELVKGNIEAYCTFEEWQDRLATLEGRYGGSNRGKGVEFLYRGLVYCPACEKLFSGWTQRVYRKNNKYEYIYYSHDCNDEDGKSVKIKETKIKELLDAQIQNFRYDESQTEYLKNVLSNIVNFETETVTNEREKLNNQINELIRQRKNLTGLFAEELIPKNELTERVTIINREIKQHETDLENVTDDISIYYDDVIDVIDYLRDFNKLYDQLTDQERVQYIKCIVNKVFYDGKEIRLEFKTPFMHLLNEKTVQQMHDFRGFSGVADGTDFQPLCNIS